jgi:cytochrome c
MRHFIITFLALSTALSTSTPAFAAGEAVRGKTLYAAKCAACHSLEYNGVGPAHRGVFERKAGVAAGYEYSPALKASSLTWNAATLDRWLANPEKLVPGQKMGIAIADAKERRDLIAYLRAAAK